MRSKESYRNLKRMKKMMPAVWIRTGEEERKRKKIEKKYGF